MGEMEMTDSDLTELLTEMRWCVDQGFMGPRSANAMRKAVMALESRASNAGGAVWIQRDHLEKAKTGAYLCRVEAEYRDGMGFVPLYPAPASKEPVADEKEADGCRDAFEKWAMQFAWFGSSKEDEFETWQAGWQARAALATAQTPAGWKLVPVEPTEEMVVAFAEAWFSKARPIDDCEMNDAYAEMLAAAPAKTECGNV
jgi:hypothetical protein